MLSQDGNTVFHLAARVGLPRAVQAMIEKGAALDVQNKYGKTPVHLACANLQEDVAQMLLMAGAAADFIDEVSLLCLIQ